MAPLREGVRLSLILSVVLTVSIPTLAFTEVRHTIPSPSPFMRTVALLATTAENNTSSLSSVLGADFSPSPSSPSPPVGVTDNWPTYEQNQQRTGDNSLENTLAASNGSQLTQMWSYTTSAGVYGSPAVVNGTVYVGDFSGNETALQATNGSREWSSNLTHTSSSDLAFTGCMYSGGVAQDTIRGITASATVWNNTLFVPADNDNLFALNASTGTNQSGWPVNLSNPTHDSWKHFYPWGSPLVFNGSVYIGAASGCDHPLTQGKLIQVGIASHAVSHIFNTTAYSSNGGSIWSTPSLEASTKTIWVTTGNCNNYGSNPNCTNNSNRWTQSMIGLDASNVCHPVGGICTTKGYWHVNGSADDDFGAGATVFSAPNGTPMVVAENKNGNVSAFFADTLRTDGGSLPAWTKTLTTTNGDISPAAFDGSTLYFGARGSGSCTNGTVWAIDTTGSVKWSQCSMGEVIAGMTYADGLVIDGTIYTNHWGGSLEVRNASTGALLDRVNFNQGISGEPVISDGRVFFGTGNQSAFCGKEVTGTHCPLGHVYAYGLPILANASTARLGILFSTMRLSMFGNASGGMPTYNYTWNWGDGATAYGRYSGAHVYSIPATYMITLTLTDAAAKTTSVRWETYWYIYSCGPPGFKICYGGGIVSCWMVLCFDSGRPTQPMQFAAAYAQASGAVTWDWHFGDGSTDSTSANPVHTYASHGTYTVTVTITDADSHMASKSFSVTV